MTSKVIGSNPMGEANGKNFLSDSNAFGSSESTRKADCQDRKDDTVSPVNAEYVKRTARLFEQVRISNDCNGKSEFDRKRSDSTNGADHLVEEEQIDSEKMSNGDAAVNSADVTDFGKKPSYLGVSCSNSGYRNVINYDSKAREGFWSSTNQRESLVLSNHRLRDSSPLKFDPDFRSHNGNAVHEAKANRSSAALCGKTEGQQGIGQSSRRMEEFVNISTSTKTISTFRKLYNKEEVTYDNKDNLNANNCKNKVNGSHNDESVKKTSSYTSLGISPRILKSPEKNCNSFLRSINSFENNCKKSQIESAKVSSYRKIRSDNAGCSVPSNSIQQRIERLYGPGALAQGFHVQNASPRMRIKSSESSEEPSGSGRLSDSINQNVKSSMESIPDLLPAAPEVVLPIDEYSDREAINGSFSDETSDEKNGRYFLKLLQKEIDRLESLAAFAEAELENGENLPEEASGKLRAAAGKARLLVRQKLHQFEGLCQKNLNEKPGEQFPTTSEDLAGFWDMVMLQVLQVYGVFDEIETLKRNNWKIETAMEETNGTELITAPDQKKKTARKTAPSAGASEKREKAEMTKKSRDESRKKLMEERRRKMKELRENKTVSSSDNDVEIFAK